MLREAEQNPSYNLKVRDGISKFKSRLSRLLDGLQRRIECFPGNPSIRVGNLALGLEDQVTEWFESRGFDPQAPHRVLNKFQTDVLSELREFEFASWGWPTRRHRKTRR